MFENMKKINQIIFITYVILFHSICLAQTPHISGTIQLSISKGIIECDLKVDNIPNINGYSIMLNSGFNVQYFRDSSDSHNYYYEKYYNEQSYEAFQYYFPNNDNTARFLPNSFYIKYVGAFPVINDTLKMGSGEDWKGNIAFNGKYMRASEQSAWYPILYDTLNDVSYEKVTYDLNIICDKDESIYLNGSNPVKSMNAHFKSDTPLDLMFFVGQYDYSNKNKTWFINTFLNEEEQNALCRWSDKITEYYEAKLKIPYGSPVTFLGATPVSKYQNWMFVTYPTIVVIGREPYNIKGYFNPNTNQIKDSSSIEFFSHEFGHYYFGTYFNPNAELKWIFLEGITEYMSLQIIRDLLGEERYEKNIQNYIEQIKDVEITPLNEIKSGENIDNNYKYNYIPLLISALENQIGQKNVWKWLNYVLESKNVKTNYHFFNKSLLESGITEKEFNDFENYYIKADNAKKNLIESFNKH